MDSSKPAKEGQDTGSMSQEFVSYFGKDAKKDEAHPSVDFSPPDATAGTSIPGSPTHTNPSSNTSAEGGKLQSEPSSHSRDVLSTMPSAESFNFTVPGISESNLKERVFDGSSADSSYPRDFAKLPIDEASRTLVAKFLQRETRNETNALLPVVDNKGCEGCRSLDSRYHKLKSLYETFIRGNPEAQAILTEFQDVEFETLRDKYESLVRRFNELVDDCNEVNPIFEQLTADLAEAQAAVEKMAKDSPPEMMDELKTGNARLADQLKASDDNYKYLEDQTKTVQRELEEERRKLADEEARHKATRDELAAKEKELKHETDELRRVEKTAERAQNQVARFEADLKRAFKEETRLTEAVTRRDQEILDHNVNNKGILTQLSEAQSQIKSFEEEVKILNATVKNYERADKELVAEKAINETLHEQMEKMQADTANRFNLDPMAYQPAILPAIKESDILQPSSLADELDLNSPFDSQTPTETESLTSEHSFQAGDADAAEASPVAEQLQEPIVPVSNEDEKEDKTVTFVPTTLNETFEYENGPAETSHPEEPTLDGSLPPTPLTRIVYVSKPTEVSFNHSPFTCWKFINLEFSYLLWVLALEAWKVITPLIRSIFGIEMPSRPPTPALSIRSFDTISDGDRTITPGSYRHRRPSIRTMMMKPSEPSSSPFPTEALKKPPASRTADRRLSSSSSSTSARKLSDADGQKTSVSAVSQDRDGSEPEELSLRYSSEAIKARWKSTVANFAVELVLVYFIYSCYGVYGERRLWLQANDATRSLLVRYLDLHSNQCCDRCHSWTVGLGLLSPRWARFFHMGFLNVAEVFRYRVRSFKMAG